MSEPWSTSSTHAADDGPYETPGSPTYPWTQWLIGEPVDALRMLPDGLVQTCIASPPQWRGGSDDPCDARVLGGEVDPLDYVESIVDLCREIDRVLRDDGTLWLHLDDAFIPAGSQRRIASGNLALIPHRVALALQRDGWWIRADVALCRAGIHGDVNCESGPQRAHSYVFLLTKQPEYFYDAEAVREASPASEAGHHLRTWRLLDSGFGGAGHDGSMHPDAVSICIRAGTSEGGCCGGCGAPFERVLARTNTPKTTSGTSYAGGSQAGELARSRQAWRALGMEGPPRPRTTGWRPTCRCGRESVPCVVLDPFGTRDTIARVARGLDRAFVGITQTRERVSEPIERDVEHTAATEVDIA